MAHFVKNLKLTVSLALVSSFLLACEGNDKAVDEKLVDGDQIELAHNDWEESLASTNVIAQVLEEIGYDVTLTSVDVSVMWQALAEGETDASVTAWLPITHGAQEEEYGDQIENLGPHTHGAKIGLAVPTYMEDLNSIEDLDDQADKTITGIEPGAGIMDSSEEAMEVYDNLADWELQNASTGAMTTELRTRYENQEEIVVTGWNPHWMFQEFDLKYLDDPENVYGDDESIYTHVRQGFEDDHPIAFSVLDNFEWEMDDLEAVVLELAETDDPELAAENWISENQEKVQEWISEAQELASESN
ncbi:Glycine betaine-binding protein precursor [Alloiococcus otitis]|uniref:ABC-type glycine betaine transport system substrate-binding domain-containing protein n=1 Tax=Alloiococcus otitis ATCC 51267 TaxID=883081 RepID=K9EB28_9LACT|nr:glycine betaine ABC transporter substrate-binding protein [Alloiococcus otitis]EKU94439.1 hypothetical protein HMPREF9698_00029 [Alloiococcus otitis ATCC 51267]SUU81369.1 Glycine betaine-binding protein precursor [Alloiococcus otitis]